MKGFLAGLLRFILNRIDFDTVIAFVLDYIADRLIDAVSDNKESLQDATKRVGHAKEALCVMYAFLKDVPDMTKKELSENLKKALLRAWAIARPSKDIEEVLQSDCPELAIDLAKVEQETKAKLELLNR